MKTKIAVIGLLVAIVMLASGCATVVSSIAKGHISDDLKVAPDPNNPFQGTWQDSSEEGLHVIKGMSGTMYTFNITSYKEFVVYKIERSGNGYVTSNGWSIRIDDDILTVGNITYRRVELE